jgi:predicted esterase YcpF (UPF0227 family)
MTIVYLHGFASSGSSPKVDDLVRQFGQDNVFSPDLPIDPQEVCKIVDKIVVNWLNTRSFGSSDRLIFVGTSLGAFYANYFAHYYDCPAILVNPSIKPNETLRNRLGSNKNYMSGEEFVVTMAYLDEMDKMRSFIESNYNGSLISLFVAKDDDVIPYELTLDALPHCSAITVTETGGHRFNDHWSLVLSRITELTNMRRFSSHRKGTDSECMEPSAKCGAH